MKSLVASGEQLVHIALMPHIEQKPVLGAIKDIVHRNGQLHDAQVGSQMSAAFRNSGDQLLTYFLRQRSQLRQRHLLQLFRALQFLQHSFFLRSTEFERLRSAQLLRVAMPRIKSRKKSARPSKRASASSAFCVSSAAARRAPSTPCMETIVSLPCSASLPSVLPI